MRDDPALSPSGTLTIRDAPRFSGDVPVWTVDDLAVVAAGRIDRLLG
jgi:hypothetical protein